MSTDLELILKIQSLDQRASELQKEIAILPRRIAEIEKVLDSHKRRLEVDRAALAANQKERKRLDDDIKVQEQKISKLKDQMTSAKTNEQYRAFQSEIEYCNKEIRKLEDRILELMTESEPLDQNMKKAEAALALETRQVEAEKKAALEKTEADRKEMEQVKAARMQAAAAARKDYISNYERIRRRAGGVAVAEAVDGRCTACNMTIRPQVMQELRQGLDGIIFCESCKRILYYNPPVLIDENA
jgi:predicted  nucleic acid-binding Zn-ribbon protein